MATAQLPVFSLHKWEKLPDGAIVVVPTIPLPSTFKDGSTQIGLMALYRDMHALYGDNIKVGNYAFKSGQRGQGIREYLPSTEAIFSSQLLSAPSRQKKLPEIQ